MRRTALAALCVAAAATATLTGCLPGEDKADSKKDEPFAGLTGAEITERALDATKGASSLRIKGEAPDEESGGTIRMDLALNTKGDCAGTISMNGEGKAEIIRTGDTVYVKLDEAFLRAQGQGEGQMETDMVVEMLAGKWTKTSASGPDSEEMTGFCDLGAMLDEFDGGTDAQRGGVTEVDGTPAITLEQTDGKDEATAYVATEGKPYILRVVSKTPGDAGDITFTDYDKPVPTAAPRGEVLDLDEFAS
ncbi:lipoprotein [Streptomyces ruber]|uniref:Lipoprotein n=2 Tax=Streptomyces TaxID=1883 RepID=A0A918ESZ3_9ACTN|nr:hypothetical protein [Streptomyces ruber]GGQ63486.1 lipoprotein [Streptomyces ruber]